MKEKEKKKENSPLFQEMMGGVHEVLNQTSSQEASERIPVWYPLGPAQVMLSIS